MSRRDRLTRRRRTTPRRRRAVPVRWVLVALLCLQAVQHSQQTATEPMVHQRSPISEDRARMDVDSSPRRVPQTGIVSETTEDQSLASVETIGTIEPETDKSPILYFSLYRNMPSRYGFPVILAVGIVSNLLSFMVILLSDIRKTSTGIYLSVLSWADMFSLIMFTSMYWGPVFLGGQFPVLNIYTFQRFVQPICICLAATSVVCVTTDRMIAVWFPFKAKQLTTRKRAVIVMGTVLATLVILYFPRLFIFSKGECNNSINATALCAYITFSELLVSITYAYATIPYLFCANIAIAVKLLRPDSAAAESSTARRSQTASKIARTVLAVSVAYLVCTIPNNVLATLIVLKIPAFSNAQAAEIVYTFSRLLMVSNHCINFFLYVLTSSKFRETLLALLTFACLRGRGTGSETANDQQRRPERAGNVSN